MSAKFCPTRPCPECPFTRGPKAVRLTRGRVRELTANMLRRDGGTFSCHKTVEYDEDGESVRRDNELHCTGAIIFADKHGAATQMMRIAGRIGMLDLDALQGRDDVFDSTREMLAAAIDRRGAR
jgi:hypothetical protein